MADWRTLTLEQAQALPEDLPGAGIYFLWNGAALVYIGASRGMLERVNRHIRTRLYGDLHVINRKYIEFDRATMLKCDIREASDIETELIKRLQPELNLLANGGNRWTFDAP